MKITKFLECYFFIILLFQTLSSSIRCERINDQQSLPEEQLPGLSDEIKRLNRSLSQDKDIINGGRRTSSKLITEHVKGGTGGGGGGGGGHKGYGGGDNINSRPRNNKSGASSLLMNSTMSLMLQLVICSFICFLVFLFGK